MPREIEKFLRDIIEAGALIQEFTHDKTLEEYEQNIMLRAAVEREFTIIGEALNQALRLDPHLVSQISATRLIIDFRNLLVHGYAVIKDDVVWGAIIDDLPRLMGEVRALLSTPS